MPSLDRFKELCNLCFGLAVHGTRLSELAQLPFLSIVQEYADRFNAMWCHACNLYPSRWWSYLWAGSLNTSRWTSRYMSPRTLRWLCISMSVRAPRYGHDTRHSPMRGVTTTAPRSADIVSLNYELLGGSRCYTCPAHATISAHPASSSSALPSHHTGRVAKASSLRALLQL